MSSPTAAPSSPTHTPTPTPTPDLSRPADPLAAGLKSLLDPTIKQTTEKLLQVHQSQLELNAELTRLVMQLKHYLDTTDPPALKPTVVKLAAVGKRLAVVNNSLQTIQGRVNKLYVQMSKQRMPYSHSQ
ncbi:uncharacterized protein LAJ45_04983 [Morchella importuna]|uniref:uncharacterized protein n=1 Tax=Morchella importuna TaxID=1174673 RepID=UPI001E8D70BF|nr:uncharacterized protein LAJ45_04983 [Morchella importuna]KAH8150802.1 hypothetical protein LAJ45_04983 [Morchella importuna]